MRLRNEFKWAVKPDSPWKILSWLLYRVSSSPRASLCWFSYALFSPSFFFALLCSSLATRWISACIPEERLWYERLPGYCSTVPTMASLASPSRIPWAKNSTKKQRDLIHKKTCEKVQKNPRETLTLTLNKSFGTVFDSRERICSIAEVISCSEAAKTMAKSVYLSKMIEWSKIGVYGALEVVIGGKNEERDNGIVWGRQEDWYHISVRKKNIFNLRYRSKTLNTKDVQDLYTSSLNCYLSPQTQMHRWKMQIFPLLGHFCTNKMQHRHYRAPRKDGYCREWKVLLYNSVWRLFFLY